MPSLFLSNHYYTYTPAKDNTSPLLVMLHGTGGDEQSLVEIGQMIYPNAGIIGIRGTVAESGHNRFFKRHSEGVYDTEDLHLRTAMLAEFLQQFLMQHKIAALNIIVIGYSNGANIAVNLLLNFPDLANTYVLWRPLFPHTPITTPQLDRHDILIIDGDSDPLTTPSQSEALLAQLRQYEARVTVEVAPGGHQLGEDDIALTRAWLEDKNLNAS